MRYVRWEDRPEPGRAVLVAAFDGWNDAAEAATTALAYLARRLGARRIATIDPEDFYDFTVARPTTRLDDDLARVIEWPTPTFEAAALPAGTRRVVFLRGVEPSLRWRTYTDEVLEVCAALGVELVVTLGALLADVPHTRPTPISGTAADPAVVAELGLQTSRYEGPTGIVGVLHDACRRAGLRSVSLWASIPHYLPDTPSPRGALALVERAMGLLGERLDPVDLQVAAAAYDRQVEEIVAAQEQVVDYVRRLEEESAEGELDVLPAETLAAEVERYLRDQGPPGE